MARTKEHGLESIKKSTEQDPAEDAGAGYRIVTRTSESALPDGAATEATLQAVLNAVDGLEGFTDGIEASLAALESYVDGVESLLTTIRDNADQLEGYTDGLEGLITSTNSLLTTIRDNADQLESFTDGLESLLTTIEGNTNRQVGTTAMFNGNVGTSAIALPTVAGNDIMKVKSICNVDNASSRRLLVSYDGGTNFVTLAPGGVDEWELRGNIKQIYIKGNTSGVVYEVVMNREP